MSISNASTAISILFAPTFVLFMHFYSFEKVAFAYAVFMFLYLLLVLLQKHNLKSASTPLVYFIFIIAAYFFSIIEFIKLIPALISGSFFLLFLNAYIQKKELILSITKKFYKKMDKDEEQYVGKSDGYWAIVVLINTLIQIILAFEFSNEIWAFYSSVGWYIYMLMALIIQILYGKIYALKVNGNL